MTDTLWVRQQFYFVDCTVLTAPIPPPATQHQKYILNVQNLRSISSNSWMRAIERWCIYLWRFFFPSFFIYMKVLLSFFSTSGTPFDHLSSISYKTDRQYIVCYHIQFKRYNVFIRKRERERDMHSSNSFSYIFPYMLGSYPHVFENMFIAKIWWVKTR